MLAEERMLKIKEFIDENGSATLPELMEKFNASESTIRRTLSAMDKEGLISRVHGGAVTNENKAKLTNDFDEAIENKRDLNRDSKIAIAKYAAALIQPGDFIYIDAGSTTDFMTDFIDEKEAIYVTNCFPIARKLGQKNLRVYLIGGEVKATTEAVVGEEAVANLSKYNFTKGFFGTNGIDIKRGLTTPEMKEGMVKKKAIAHSKEKYVVADASKFDVISPINFAAIDELQIITTGSVPDSYKKLKNLIVI